MFGKKSKEKLNEQQNDVEVVDEKKPLVVGEKTVDGVKNNKTVADPKKVVGEIKEEDRPGFFDFKKVGEYTNEYQKKIESNRIALNKFYTRDRIIRYSVVVICLFGFFFSWLYILNQLQMKGLGFGIIGASAAIMIIYLVISKVITKNTSGNYLNSYYSNLNLSTFIDSKKFRGLTYDLNTKKTKKDFEENGAFSNISRILPRNEVNFLYNGKTPVNVCDLAAFSIGKDKYERPVFVGKYLTISNVYKGEDPIYIYLKGYKLALPPTAIDEVAKVYNSQSVTIQTNNKQYKKSLEAKTIELLDKYVCNNILLDATIVIKKGVTYMCLGYSDEFEVIPFKSKFNPEPFKQYLSDLDLFIKVNSEIK